MPQLRPGRGADADLEDEQRRGDREDAVAERLEPCRAFIHARIVATGADGLHQCGCELPADQPHRLEVGVQQVLEHHALAAGASYSRSRVATSSTEPTSERSAYAASQSSKPASRGMRP